MNTNLTLEGIEREVAVYAGRLADDYALATAVRDEARYYRPTVTSLAYDTPDYWQVYEVAESWAGDRSVDEIIDRNLDGTRWDVDGEERILDLGNNTIDPMFRRVRQIVRQVVKEQTA